MKKFKKIFFALLSVMIVQQGFVAPVKAAAEGGDVVSITGTTSFVNEQKDGQEWKPAGASVKRGPNEEIELGVVVFPHESVATFAAQLADTTQVPLIQPHITLIQGLFTQPQIEQLQAVMERTVHDASWHPIAMQPKLVKHAPSGNVFWDVDVEKDKAGAAWLTTLNYLLCVATKKGGEVPAERMWQVWQDLEGSSLDAIDREYIDRWARDFNVPPRNRPHVTVGYGPLVGDQEQVLTSTTVPTELQAPLMPRSIGLCQIDERGNVVKVIHEFMPPQ